MYPSSVGLLDDLVTPLSNCFSPDVARRIASLKASDKLQARIDELGEKCNQGELTGEEQLDYERSSVFQVHFRAPVESMQTASCPWGVNGPAIPASANH